MDLKRILPAVLLLVILGGGLFYGGYYLGTQKPQNLNIHGISEADLSKVGVTADFSVFWQVWDRIKSEHIDGDKAKDKDLMYGSAAGMVNALKDPNTIFLPPSDSKKLEEDVRGVFGGIGAEIGIRNDQLVIIAPLKDSPAEKAGLLAADKILKVDDTFTDGLTANEAVKIIRGEAGTKVKLLILRNGWNQPKDFVITREVIRVPTAELKMPDPEIAQIKLFAFNENAPRAIYNALIKASDAGTVNGLILDLRNNPGGFLEIAVDLAGWFLPPDSVVATERFRSGKEIVFRARGNGALKEFPMVILVNPGSASASEILAGALRDHRGIKLVGEKTFGKGSVQEIQELKDGSSLKITVAHWVLPKGQIIEKTGLVPDFEVKLTEEDIKAGKDPQLDKAVAILKSIISK